ncbi:MAG: transporter, binding subunit [Geminicoccaceae bacterium]|jgi:ABC-2 type transport system ATP-binding protein|nr:transporter, binding subunit [Geminicoccaceae bacterium]
MAAEQQPSRTEPSTEAPLVRVTELWKSFPAARSLAEVVRQPFHAPSVPAVVDVSLDVHAGEFVGLLGPNGAGKTTLLKVLATLIAPDRGAATVAGHDVVRDASSVRRVIAPVLANERSLYWRLSAHENLELFAALLRLPKSEIDSRVADALDVVGLRDTGRKMVGQFSAGMMQRLLVARALLGHPRVLLLDEPTRSLDPTAAHSFRTFLREELAARRRCAVLIATHRTEEAFELCDRVIVMHRGRVAAEGHAATLGEALLGSRYGVWTREPNHGSLAELVASGRAKRVAARSEGAGHWWRVDLEIEGGDDAAQDVLRSLVTSGISVARFERVVAPLGELMERAIGRSVRR